MKTQELKEKLMELAHVYDSVILRKQIESIFEGFEQSNKSDSIVDQMSKIWQDDKCDTRYVSRDEIKTIYSGLHKLFADKFYEELETLKKQVKDDRFYSEHGISELKQAIILLENKQEKNEPKQERFTITSYNLFTLLENNEFYMSFKVASDAVIIRDKLNKLDSLEGK